MELLGAINLHLRTTVNANNKSSQKQHFVRVDNLGEAHEAGAGDAEHIVQQQAALASEAIRHPAAAEAAQHSANREYRHSHRVQLLNKFFADILSIAILVDVLHKVLYVYLRCIYDSSVVAKLKHAQNGSEYRIR